MAPQLCRASALAAFEQPRCSAHGTNDPASSATRHAAAGAQHSCERWAQPQRRRAARARGARAPRATNAPRQQHAATARHCKHPRQPHFNTALHPPTFALSVSDIRHAARCPRHAPPVNLSPAATSAPQPALVHAQPAGGRALDASPPERQHAEAPRRRRAPRCEATAPAGCCPRRHRPPPPAARRSPRRGWALLGRAARRRLKATRRPLGIARRQRL